MKPYGVIGLLLIILIQLNFYFKIEPFAYWYFPLIWTGYILLIDALVYKFKGSSLLINHPKRFMFYALLSLGVWWIFELINGTITNWNYHLTTLRLGEIQQIISKNLSFATVIPAVFETTDLILALHWFDHTKFRKKHLVSKSLLIFLILLGVLCLILPFLFPHLFYPLVWVAFFFLLDPLNYLNNQPSIIQHLKDRRLKTPLSFAFGALICGFFWEFWNYWAVRKWTYAIPYLDFLKIFEMPILGYLGYLPFGLELYTIVIFTRYYLRQYFHKSV